MNPRYDSSERAAPFQPQVRYAAGFTPLWVTAGDLSADGKLDLAVCSGGTSPATSRLSLSLPIGPNAMTVVDSGECGLCGLHIECAVGLCAVLSAIPSGHHACCLYRPRALAYLEGRLAQRHA